jgi:uncharacterized membrane protein
MVGAVTGIAAAAVALEHGASWSVAALCASDVAALVFIIWVWVTVSGADAAATAAIARGEDSSRAAAEAVLVGAGAASLLAVAFTLAQAGDASAPGRGLLTALAIGSVALAWTSVHTVYVPRYASCTTARPTVGSISTVTPRPTWTSPAVANYMPGVLASRLDPGLGGDHPRRAAARARVDRRRGAP